MRLLSTWIVHLEAKHVMHKKENPTLQTPKSPDTTKDPVQPYRSLSNLHTGQSDPNVVKLKPWIFIVHTSDHLIRDTACTTEHQVPQLAHISRLHSALTTKTSTKIKQKFQNRNWNWNFRDCSIHTLPTTHATTAAHNQPTHPTLDRSSKAKGLFISRPAGAPHTTSIFKHDLLRNSTP